MAWRGAEAVALLVVLASLVFLALRTLPGDPAALILGDQASAAELSALRARLGFDRPLYVQYAHYLRGLLTLDFGDSLRRPGVRAAARVFEALGPTGELAGLAVAMGSVVGITSAVLAVGPWLGAGRRHVERAFVVVASTPLLAFAPLLTYVFAVRWRVLPLPGDPDAGFLGLVFASALLAVPLSAHVARIGRAALQDVSGAPFLTVVRAKGGSFARAWFLHGLPATSGPIVTTIGTQLGALLGGAVVLERLFERPGLGTLILESYASRDLPVLEASVVAAGSLFVATQAIAGAVHAAIDPRVRS
ncbi:ABC transporter permease [Pendulispora brunnea]|uniref:ABC transporter permease n=1 Tax=Pendulispora brunnea TaxID=2905690 RepID=A0ABZ2KMY0_9BACT